MQLCNLEVRLNDSPGHTVPKFDVTPAEIQVLQAIHGPSAIVGIQPVRMDKRAQSFEWERLNSLYGKPSEGLADAGNGDLLQKLFPGANKRLPITLKDIGLGHLLNPGAASPPVSEPTFAEPEDDDGAD